MEKKLHSIAVFGGTFDPPHKGHFQLAAQVMTHGFSDEVMFVPALHPPHKSSIVSSSFEDRLNMIQLGVKHANEPRFFVNDIEGRRLDVPSYTYDTMMELSCMFDDTELILLLGGDSLMTIHTWYRAEDIADNWKILTYPRSGFTSLAELRNFWPEGIASKLAETILPFEICDISSTEIRGKIQCGNDVRSILYPEIYEYIKKRGLYKRG